MNFREGAKRKKKKKEIHCRGESKKAKHKLGFGRPDAEGQCLGEGVNNQLFSERMRSCNDGG